MPEARNHPVFSLPKFETVAYVDIILSGTRVWSFARGSKTGV